MYTVKLQKIDEIILKFGFTIEQCLQKMETEWQMV